MEGMNMRSPDARLVEYNTDLKEVPSPDNTHSELVPTDVITDRYDLGHWERLQFCMALQDHEATLQEALEGATDPRDRETYFGPLEFVRAMLHIFGASTGTDTISISHTYQD